MPTDIAQNSPTPGWWQTPLARAVTSSLFLVGTVILLAALCQLQFGIFGSKKWIFAKKLQGKVRQEGKAYKVPIPEWAQGPLAEDNVVLMRAGVPFGTRVAHTSRVVEHGNGSYKIHHRYLYFSLPKNDDPNPGLRRLSIAVPTPVSSRIWLAGGLCVLLGGIGTWINNKAKGAAMRMGRRFYNLPDAAIVLAVLLFATVVTLSRIPDAMTFSDGWFSIKGIPFSDAAAWDQLAISLSRGEGFVGGFSAQRPLYPAMLGLIYSVTGPMLMAAKVLNAAWLALAVAGVCAIGIYCGSRMAGIAAALSMLINADQRTFSQMLMTETSGVVFGVAALLALCVAVKRPAWWLIVLAGLLLACANLASGFGLFALLGYGLVALCTWWHRQGFRKAFLHSLLLAGVVALAWSPWLIRQKVVHGIANLASSGAVLMYATAVPEYGGRFTRESAGEWHEQHVPDSEGARYKYYMDKYRDAVKADPMSYTKAVWKGMQTFSSSFSFRGQAACGVVLLMLGIGALLLMLRHPPWAVLPALLLVLAGCYSLQDVPAMPLWAISTVILLATCPPDKRGLWALVAVTVPFVILLGGVTGGMFGRRMWSCCSWSMILLLTAAGMGTIKQLTFLLLRWRMPSQAPLVPDEAEGNREQGRVFLFRFSIALSCLLLLNAAAGSAVVTTLWLTHRDGAHTPVPPEIPAEALRQLTARLGHEAPPHTLVAGVMEFGEYTAELKGWEDSNHWARSFAPRPYSRTVAFGRSVDEVESSPWICQIRWPAADLPRHTPLLVVGVKNEDPTAHLGHDTLFMETFGFVPLHRNGGSITVDWAQMTWTPAPLEAWDILAGRKPQG